MKRAILYISLLYLFIGFSLSQNNTNIPRIFCKGNPYNVGKVNAKLKTVSHTFKIINMGTDLLKIIKVTKTCSCTNYKVSNMEVMPGKWITVDITVNIEDKYGNFEDGIFLKTNDPENETYPVMIKGEVMVDYLIYPETVYFGIFHPSDFKKEKEIVNVRIFSKKIKGIKSIELDNPLLSYDVKPDRKNNFYSIIIYFTKKPPYGYRDGKMTITLDSEKTISKEIFYTYKVVPRIKVRPESISFSTIKSSNPQMAIFYLYYNKPFEILKVTIPDGFSYKLKRLKNRLCVYRFELYPEEEKTPENWNEKDIVIRTSLDEDPIVVIKIINDKKM